MLNFHADAQAIHDAMKMSDNTGARAGESVGSASARAIANAPRGPEPVSVSIHAYISWTFSN